MTIEIQPVRTRRDKEAFLTFPWQLYRDDPHWVPPMMPEQRMRLDPKRSAWFQRGMADFYRVFQHGQPVGRFCVGIDYKANNDKEIKEATFGYFEVVEDYAIAEAMFDFISEWAREHGMETIYGPFNLDYEDCYGVLLQGYEIDPVMLCGHNPPYYLAYYERYGFEKGRPENIALRIDLAQPRPEFAQLHATAERVRRRGRYTIRNADFSHWEKEVDVLHKLLNESLKHLEGHTPWHRAAVSELVAQFRAIAEPELILFMDDTHTGETVGFLPGTINMNEHFKRYNGLRYPWNYPGFLLNFKKTTHCLTVKSVLLLPEYWGTGAALLMFDELVRRIEARPGFSWIDLSLTAVDNPQTPKLAKRMGAEVYKMYRVFRKAV
ncbi:MAG: GNAT family N-acetyltransferase [Anaerolineae bacterium]|nr:GNAT family N-acetyltransferase [Anaerolineae bacterium]